MYGRGNDLGERIMGRIRQIILGVLLAAALSTFACWFTSDNYDGNYIAGVNNFQEHYTEGQSFQNAEYHNNRYVALPITVYVKVHSINNETPTITRAVLQYRVRRNGSWLTPWITVRTITNPSATLDYSVPVPLFGNGTIDPKNLQSEDEIIIRYYCTNGVIQSGDLNDPLNSINPNSTEYANNYSNTYTGGWTPPFVFKVIYNGERRVGW